MINLKDNIWIDCFDTPKDKMVFNCDLFCNETSYEVLYQGKTTGIPRELAKEVFAYGYDDLEIHFTTLDEVIKEACPQPYCIIYKK